MPFRKAYLQSLIDVVQVNDHAIRIRGSKISTPAEMSSITLSMPNALGIAALVKYLFFGR